MAPDAQEEKPRQATAAGAAPEPAPIVPSAGAVRTTGEAPLPATTIAAETTDPEEDAESALGDEDDASITTSLRSTIFQYRMEHGRTYHGYLESIGYVLPNDETEQDRLDLQHHLFRLTLQDKLFLCPAGNDGQMHNVLDAGTGTGSWAMDIADENPHTKVMGIDISPIQPSFVPPNASFVMDDLEQDWDYPTPFDFVFARMLTGSICDWPRFIRQSFDNLESKGWIELQDIAILPNCQDGTLPEDAYTRKWGSAMREAAGKLGRPADSATRYRQQMIDAGFVNVTEVVYRWPSNPWPADKYYKELGLWCSHSIANELNGLSLALFTRALGWSQEEVTVFLAKTREEMRDKHVHTWWPIYVVYGQKP